MYTRTKALANYGKIANAEADPLMQIVMLYDGAIKFLNLTAADIEANNLINKAEHSNRALDIINYLQTILNFERGGDSAVILDNFYRSLTVLILRGSNELNAALVRRAAELLAPVRDSWETNARNNSSSSISFSGLSSLPAASESLNLTAY